MADFDIKPASGTGNSLRLKNEAGNIVLSTNNGTGASSWGTVPPAGTILQVQSTTLTTGYTASNASWTDITGLSVSITPKLDTSKILILASINITASNDHRSRLMRGSTPIAVGTQVTFIEDASCFYSYIEMENGGPRNYHVGLMKIKINETGEIGWIWGNAVELNN